MNISETHYLFSSISKFDQQIANSIDIFYIGTFIGLAWGILSWCVIWYFKYKKRKTDLASFPIEVTI